MTKRRKRSKTFNHEPEPMIQLIQSFLTGKEAARTTVLSKSWYAAWLTRPTFDFDQHDFNNSKIHKFPKYGFAEAMTKNMQRYQDSNMKIDSFRLRLASYSDYRMMESEILINKLIASALKSGATELDLDLISAAFVLPGEVFESEQLERLSLINMRMIAGNVRCWRLKSLNLHKLRLGSDAMIMDILSCCPLIEELSLSLCLVIHKRMPKMIDLSGMNMFKLHKLRRMFLEKVRLDRLFFSEFASRFPCMKDLIVSECCYIWSDAIQISSASLESMSFVKVGLTAEFDVPNLASFRYSGEGIPSLRIASSRGWESDISIPAIYVDADLNSWYLRLKKLMTQLRSSNISLCISRGFAYRNIDIKAVSGPLAVENLMLDPPCHFGYKFLSALLSICRPKFLAIYWLPLSSWCPEESNLFNRVMKEIITPYCEVSDQNMKENMFGQLGLKDASVEEHLGGQWQPLLLNEQTTQECKRKLRFRLRWG